MKNYVKAIIEDEIIEIEDIISNSPFEEHEDGTVDDENDGYDIGGGM